MRHCSALAVVALAVGVSLAADKPILDEQVKFFEAKIRPVLVDKCYSCHSSSATKLKGGLNLETRDGLLKGGDTGPALVPGNARKSLLVKALKAADNVSQMPPKEKVSEDVVADFEKWIGLGAPDPRTGEARPAARTIDIAKGKEHWSFQPVKTVEPPKGSEWATSPVDQFVEAMRKDKDLKPVADADKKTLLRRVYFDLIGLPPTPEQLDAFLKDKSPDAYAKVVDQLLSSPHFGERWGRHWLDVARYAESSGKDRNMIYPHAWRYRDYVIAAFNSDKPVNEFFKEQLAGDLMGGKDDTQKAERTIATGYLAVGPKSHTERNPKQFELDVADEQIDAFSQGMLGVTIACARCHDHKFDPIPTRDYYAIAGIFTSTDTRIGVPRILIARNGSDAVTLPAKADVAPAPSISKREFDTLKGRLDDLKTRRDKAIEEAKKDKQPPVQLVALNAQIGTVESTLALYDADGKPKNLAMAATDKLFSRDMPIHIRGELDKTGEVVPRGFLQVIDTGSTPKLSRKESGRRELADWVTSEKNPLTARVYVNRVWGHLFGKGLVSTPDNFGTTGLPPSHPALLDHLAAQFMADNWSTKTLIRTLVTSHTYRLSSEMHAADFAIDPDNVYLWRMSKRRLDAEVIRDSMYAVSGTLDATPAVASPVARSSGLTQALERYGMSNPLGETNKRSVYLPLIRDSVPEALELFDFAEPSLIVGSREDTSVPAQGLYLLNNATVMKLAADTADRISKKSQSESERLDTAFRLVLGRPASPKEADAASLFLSKFRTLETKRSLKKADVDKAAWAALVQALFATAEFRYVD